MLYRTLQIATHLRPGTFVEIGAFDGVNLSNTYMLERCYDWRGLLIEANPENFRRPRGGLSRETWHEADRRRPVGGTRTSAPRTAGPVQADDAAVAQRCSESLAAHAVC